MIIGSYTLSVICDVEGCVGGGYGEYSSVADFSAPTEGMARKKARRHGWKVLVSKDMATCPSCADKHG